MGYLQLLVYLLLATNQDSSVFGAGFVLHFLFLPKYIVHFRVILMNLYATEGI